MIDFYVTEAELEKALSVLREASDRGFGSSQAVFRLSRTNKDDKFCRTVREDDSEFTDQIILKADPVDPSKNWGRMSSKFVDWYRIVDGVFAEE